MKIPNFREKKEKTMEKISIEKLETDHEYVVYLNSKEEWEELNKLCEFNLIIEYFGQHCYSPKNASYCSRSSCINPGTYSYKGKPSKIITINQIKEYNMEKEIIGYKLIKPEYEQAVESIASNYLTSIYMDIENYPNVIKKLKEAGVLELWFESIYREEEKVVSVGGQFNVTVKSTGIFHGNDDITEFVQGMEKIVTLGSFGTYVYTISDIIFSKTGCQNKETKLSDWKRVWEEYQRIK